MDSFTWKVAAKGYEWAAEEKTDRDLYLKSIEDGAFREYQPLKEFTGLFRTFADTPLTRKGVMAFANRFGNLGFGSGGVGGDLDDEWEGRSDGKWRQVDETRDLEPNMENVGAWFQQVKRMRRCVDNWNSAQSGKADERTMRKLQETVGNQLRGRVRVVFSRDRRVGGFLLEIMPINLLGALWLQLAQTISGSKTHRPCKTCGNWFEVSPKKYRKSRFYCSEACRSQAYRDRQNKVKALAGQGKSPQEIARELDINVKTIKGWLKQKKG